MNPCGVSDALQDPESEDKSWIDLMNKIVEDITMCDHITQSNWDCKLELLNELITQATTKWHVEQQQLWYGMQFSMYKHMILRAHQEIVQHCHTTDSMT